ncbi:RiPP maturation radical SAM C-methyltransferase [Streptomyces sp. NPDC059785]|uniref:RiPP maturation radical SAM C-methyltransferase n=1 Tax=Streptomyces sp. NPDC059785 TaxID=3346945 RepID=UPI0036565867
MHRRPDTVAARHPDAGAARGPDAEAVRGPDAEAVRGPDAEAARRASWPVVLVCMPFMDDRRPSLQLGLLAAIAAAHGFPARTFHANLDFAARIGVDRYRRLADRCGRMLGDWLFSPAAFGPAAPDPHGEFLDLYAEELAYTQGESVTELRERLLRIRDHDVPAYLDALVTGYPWSGFRVVGLTSTFQQNTASVALARLLKAAHPRLLTLLGGANLDDGMGLELLRTADCVDAAVIGEGDEAFPRLLRTLAEDGDLATVPGLAHRAGGRVVTGPPARLVRDLDSLPVPDYDEYFRHAEELGLLARTARRPVAIPLETARGCWWGMRHHCTFCGLNGQTMEFRAKSAERVLAEFAEQTRRYRTFRFEPVDNILDTRYLRTLFPALIESDAQYEIFYEVKANLTRRQLKTLADAGVTRIQPGIESLSSPVLAAMRKGVTAAQNINLLRWAAHYRIEVVWNLLWGFPGETPEDCAAQTALLPHLWHLRPPESAARITMERFSPLFEDRAGILRNLRPEASYRNVYPAGADLGKIAYFFDCDIEGALPESCYAPLVKAVDEWWNARRDDGSPPVLEYRQAPHYVHVYDGRRTGQEGTYVFEDLAADVYLACCERPVTPAAVRERVDRRLSTAQVRRVLGEFAERGLVFTDGPRTVALAVPASRP